MAPQYRTQYLRLASSFFRFDPFLPDLADMITNFTAASDASASFCLCNPALGTLQQIAFINLFIVTIFYFLSVFTVIQIGFKSAEA